MHPASNRNSVRDYVEGRKLGILAAHDLDVSYEGAPDVDFVDQVDETLEDVLAAWREMPLEAATKDQARDEVEGQLAVVLHSGLRDLPASVLTDRNFWRYCAAYLYDFVVWRQTSESVLALLPYFGVATTNLGRECVPHRMFDRAHIASTGGAGDDDPYALAKIGASDVWKSHILRVQHGNAPRVAYEILTRVAAGDLKTEVVRKVAKNLQRVRSNAIFEILDQDQAHDLVEREAARARASLLDDQSHPD